jgi:hypothetical protein
VPLLHAVSDNNCQTACENDELHISVQQNIKFRTNNFADPGGRAVNGVDLQSFDHWDRGFGSRRGHGCSPLVFVVLCR